MLNTNFVDPRTGRKDCHAILQHWLNQQDLTQHIWANLSYREIVQDIKTKYKVEVSASSVSILLPGLVADMSGRTVAEVMQAKEMFAREKGQRGAKIDVYVLEDLRDLLEDGMSPKQCAHELGLHYNTVLKYRRIFEMEED